VTKSIPHTELMNAITIAGFSKNVLTIMAQTGAAASYNCDDEGPAFLCTSRENGAAFNPESGILRELGWEGAWMVEHRCLLRR
jgi:hypothetical protein